MKKTFVKRCRDGTPKKDFTLECNCSIKRCRDRALYTLFVYFFGVPPPYPYTFLHF